MLLLSPPLGVQGEQVVLAFCHCDPNAWQGQLREGEVHLALSVRGLSPSTASSGPQLGRTPWLGRGGGEPLSSRDAGTRGRRALPGLPQRPLPSHAAPAYSAPPPRQPFQPDGQRGPALTSVLSPLSPALAQALPGTPPTVTIIKVNGSLSSQSLWPSRGDGLGAAPRMVCAGCCGCTQEHREAQNEQVVDGDHHTKAQRQGRQGRWGEGGRPAQGHDHCLRRTLPGCPWARQALVAVALRGRYSDDSCSDALQEPDTSGVSFRALTHCRAASFLHVTEHVCVPGSELLRTCRSPGLGAFKWQNDPRNERGMHGSTNAGPRAGLASCCW